MRPLDVAVLLKIITYGGSDWKQQQLSLDLHLSQSEISKSVARSKYAGLLDEAGKHVRRLAFMDFLEKGIAYVFPQRPGAIVRGVPTSHSASPDQIPREAPASRRISKYFEPSGSTDPVW